MEDRDRYDLRQWLAIWSFGLSVFSIIGFYNMSIPHFKQVLFDGYHSSICAPTLRAHQGGLWIFLFVSSKLFELGDTYFVILRKQKLILLHWYHHITVFMYCWWNYCLLISTGQSFSAMNYSVHSIMYMYYAVRASGLYRPPKWINMFITALQLTQMLAGVSINGYVYYLIRTGQTCDGFIETDTTFVYVSFAMYFSYFVLFAEFFYSAYFKKPPASGEKEKDTTSKHNCNGLIAPRQDKFNTTNGIRHR